VRARVFLFFLSSSWEKRHTFLSFFFHKRELGVYSMCFYFGLRGGEGLDVDGVCVYKKIRQEKKRKNCKTVFF